MANLCDNRKRCFLLTCTVIGAVGTVALDKTDVFALDFNIAYLLLIGAGCGAAGGVVLGAVGSLGAHCLSACCGLFSNPLTLHLRTPVNTPPLNTPLNTPPTDYVSEHVQEAYYRECP